MLKTILLRLSILIPLFGVVSLDAREKVIVSGINYPPLNYPQNIEHLGYGVGRDIVDAAFKSVSISTDYKFLPLVRNVQSLMTKKSQANLGMIEWFDKKGVAQQVDAVEILNLYFTFFYLTARFPDIRKNFSVKKMQNYSVGGIRGSTSDKILKSQGIDIEPSNSIYNSFLKLQSKRIDFAVALDITGWRIIEEKFADQVDLFSMIDRPILKSTLSLIFHGDETHLREQFQQGFRKIIVNGEYERILKRYYNNHVSGEKLYPESVYQLIQKNKVNQNK